MNEPKPNRIYGVIGKWKDQCTNYQEMKEKCVKLLEHPEATEAQLLETARCLRDVRKSMSAMQEQLNSSFTQYKFDLTGKVSLKSKPFLFDTKKQKAEFVAPRSLSIATKKSTTV